MAAPNRNVVGAPSGAITATPKRVLNRLGITVMRVRGVKGRGRRR